ncbi:MAG: sulfate adenylyltransferase [Phycisphaerae bacterium]|nr:sulfate adenylyltransferase [Phycisphaerae bacterium]MDW8261141.1 sulfate adenylyltransferase [Phycisphaerales bacterium]
MSLVSPHGGNLINRQLEPAAARRAQTDASLLTAVTLSPREACDLEMIAIGAFSPLTGFMGESDYLRVCREMRLASGLVWPIPVVLSPADDVSAAISVGERIALRDSQGRLLAVMTVSEKFRHDKSLEIPSVYQTEDPKHPGVAVVQSQGNWCLAGPIDVICPNYQPEFPSYRLTPAQTRAAFEQRGWNTVAAFQTRNPIHRSHEYLTKVALEMTDGLLIHPVVGETKSDDIPADVRMECYQALVDNYYNPQRTMLSVMPLAMRYAGPREAVMHTLIRRNYGVSHFIVGRDHAGVGNYYGTYDAQKIFDQFDVPREIGVTILKFEHTAWCNRCEAVVSAKTCPHGPEDKVAPSGTKVREMLLAGQRPPPQFSRPEVADILIRWARA